MKLNYRGIEIVQAGDGSCTYVSDGRQKTAPNYKRACDQIRSHQWHARHKKEAASR